MMTRSILVCLALAVCACDPQPTIVGGGLDEPTERLSERWRYSPPPGVLVKGVAQRPDGTIAVHRLEEDGWREQLVVLSGDGTVLSTALLPGRFLGIAADGDDILMVGPTAEAESVVSLHRMATDAEILETFDAPLSEREEGIATGVVVGPDELSFSYSSWSDIPGSNRAQIVRLSPQLEPRGGPTTFERIQEAKYGPDGSLWVLEGTEDGQDRVHNLDTGVTAFDTRCDALVLDAPIGPSCLQLTPSVRLHPLDGSSAPIDIPVPLEAGFSASGYASAWVGTSGGEPRVHLFGLSAAAEVTGPLEFAGSEGADASYPFIIDAFEDGSAAMVVFEQFSEDACFASGACLRAHVVLVDRL